MIRTKSITQRNRLAKVITPKRKRKVIVATSARARVLAEDLATRILSRVWNTPVNVRVSRDGQTAIVSEATGTPNPYTFKVNLS